MDFVIVNDIKYEIIKLLGHGKGGYSYLVTDGNNKYVYKQIHHEPCDYYNFGNKIEAERNDYRPCSCFGSCSRNSCRSNHF